jgi:hypothetical protein
VVHGCDEVRRCIVSRRSSEQWGRRILAPEANSDSSCWSKSNADKCLFLDDDVWLEPGSLERLSNCTVNERRVEAFEVVLNRRPASGNDEADSGPPGQLRK